MRRTHLLRVSAPTFLSSQKSQRTIEQLKRKPTAAPWMPHFLRPEKIKKKIAVMKERTGAIRKVSDLPMMSSIIAERALKFKPKRP